MGTEEHRRAHRRRVGSAVARRFPEFEFAVHDLMERSEFFRDMCEELIEAESVLSRIDSEPSWQGEAVRADWQACLERLLAELEAELRSASSKSS
jgi:hypothetical protein